MWKEYNCALIYTDVARKNEWVESKKQLTFMFDKWEYDIKRQVVRFWHNETKELWVWRLFYTKNTRLMNTLKDQHFDIVCTLEDCGSERFVIHNSRGSMLS
jgi:hypothetical protein